jgi:hypothetical protein
MRNKKAEMGAITIILLIVGIGLIAFFGYKFITHKATPLNVTQLNDTPTSTVQVIKPNGEGINLTGENIEIVTSNGTNLTLVNHIEMINITNDTSKVLIKVYYPNNTLTPGAIMSSNVSEICVSGYSASVRNVSQSTKDAVYKLYKLSPDQPTGAFQIDHLINLANGGSNDITNLWPQPCSPKPGCHEKDVLENYLHRQVCSGEMELRAAQSILATNWMQGYVDAVQAGGIKGNEDNEED